MARIRSVKPEIRTSEDLLRFAFEVRYFFVLLWGYLDDKGRGLDIPKAIAGDCYPRDDKITPAVVDRWLTMMTKPVRPTEPPPVCRYTIDGRRYLHAPRFHVHNRINRPTPSRLPPCPTHDKPGEPLTESRSTRAVSDSLSDSMPGAGEQGSRGAGEQQQRPRSESLTPPTLRAIAAAAQIIEAETGCDPDAAKDVAQLIAREKQPRNLAGLVKHMADADELGAWLEAHAAIGHIGEVAAAIDAARKGEPCEHGTPGGMTPHPTTGQPLCPQCRAERRTP